MRQRVLKNALVLMMWVAPLEAQQFLYHQVVVLATDPGNGDCSITLNADKFTRGGKVLLDTPTAKLQLDVNCADNAYKDAFKSAITVTAPSFLSGFSGASSPFKLDGDDRETIEVSAGSWTFVNPNQNQDQFDWKQQILVSKNATDFCKNVQTVEPSKATSYSIPPAAVNACQLVTIPGGVDRNQNPALIQPSFVTFSGTRPARSGGTDRFDVSLQIDSYYSQSLAGAGAIALFSDGTTPRIQVVQAVQASDLASEVPLVFGKSAIARVFLKSTTGQDITSGITGTLTALESPGESVTAFNADAIAPGGTPDPNNQRHSLNFLLPAKWMLPRGPADKLDNNTTQPLTLTATITVNGQKDTKTRGGFLMRVSPFSYPLNTPYLEVCAPTCPDHDLVDAAGEFLRRTLPIPDSGLKYGPSALVPLIAWPRVIHDQTEQFRLAMAVRAIYKLSEKEGFTRFGPYVWEPYATNSSGNCVNCLGGLVMPDYCSDSEPGKCLRPLIVKTYTQPAKLAATLRTELTIGGYGFPNMDTFYPSTTKSLSDSSLADEKWISLGAYRKLIETGAPVRSIFASRPVVNKTAKPKLAVAANLLVIGGTVQADGSAGTLMPGYTVQSTNPPPDSDPAGNTCLVFTASGGTTNYCFDTSFDEANADGSPGLGIFSVKAPLPDGVTQVALSFTGGAPLATINAASAPPVVTMISPQAGDSWSGTQTISWTAADLDGNALSYAVLYSPDNGVTWQPMMANLTEPQFSIDTGQIVGGASVLFRVLASNGILTGTATAGPLALPQSPLLSNVSSVDFGNVSPGQLADRTVAFTNTGTGPLLLSSISFDNDEFTLVRQNQYLPPIQAGQTWNFTIRYVPRKNGASASALTINSNDATLPTRQIRLTGSSGGPVISVSPSRLDFGAITVGSSKELTVTLTNSGSQTISVTTQQGTSGYFLFQGDSAFNVAAGQTVNSKVRFTPLGIANYAETLTFVTNDPLNPRVPVSMTGSAVASASPTITITPSVLDFGIVAPGKSVTLTYIMQNISNNFLRVGGPGTNGPLLAVFPIHGLNFSLNPGEKVALSATFSPVDNTPQSETITYNTSDPANDNVSIKLMGNVSTPKLVPSVQTLDFGTVNVGAAPATRTLTINNTGNGQANIRLTASGPFTVVSPPSPFLLNPAGTVTVTLNFAPTAATPASQTGSLTISADGLSPIAVSLTGTSAAAAACTYTLSPLSQSVAAAGATGSFTVTPSAGSCAWTAVPNAAWLTITSGTTGTGTGTVAFSAVANTATAARSGTITAGGATFTVNQAATATAGGTGPAGLSGSVSVETGETTFNLTTEGTSDWIHWDDKTNRKIGGSQLGTLAVVDNQQLHTYTGGSRTLSWTDGAPTLSATGNRSGLFVNGSGNGFTITAPADTTTRTVTVHVIAFAATKLTLSGHLSDNSGDYTDVQNSPGSTSYDYTLSYRAASAGQTLTIKWILTTGDMAGANAGIAGIALSAGGTVTAPTCSYSLSPTSQSLAAGAGTGSFTVTPSPSSCGWTATANDSWLTVTSGPKGTGNGTVAFAAAANTATTARTGTITAGGVTFTVNQAATVACSYTLSPTSQSLPAAAGTGSFAVTPSAPSCAWTAASNASWITVTSGASGTGIGTVGFTVAANTATTARSGTITAGGVAFTVNQAAAGGGTSSGNLTGSVSLETGETTFNLTAEGPTDWLHWDSQTNRKIGGNQFGTLVVGNINDLHSYTGGSRTLSWTDGAPTRSDTANRSGIYVNGAGNGFTITAPADTTTRTVTVHVISYAADKLTFTAHLSDNSGDFTDTQSSPGTSNAYDYTLSYRAASAGQTLTIKWVLTTATAAGANAGIAGIALSGAAVTACSFTLSPTSQSLAANAGTGSFTMTPSASSCAWTASSNAAWLTINSGASGTGNGTVAFSAAANTTAASRSGTITAGGVAFTVNQAAAAATSGDTTTGLVSWWKFDEGIGQTVRDTMGANNGTIQGTASWTTGRFGAALNFDGSTNFVLGANAGLGFPVGSAARTISAWVKVSSPPSIDNGVFHYGTASSTGAVNFHLFLYGSTNAGKVGIGNGYGYGTLLGTSNVGDGAWHNIIGVYEGAGGLARIYVDGVQQTSGVLSTTPNTGTGTAWQIGRFQAAGPQPFRGAMDDVRIYNRALTSADVQAIYNGQ